MDGQAWWATVHGVAKSRTRLSDFTEQNRTEAEDTKKRWQEYTEELSKKKRGKTTNRDKEDKCYHDRGQFIKMTQ